MLLLILKKSQQKRNMSQKAKPIFQPLDSDVGVVRAKFRVIGKIKSVTDIKASKSGETLTHWTVNLDSINDVISVVLGADIKGRGK